MSKLEIVTAVEAASADLQQHARIINEKVAIITGHEAAFEEATLEHRLQIGLELAKAKAVFGMTKAQAGAIGGSMSPGDMLKANPLGFTNWLAREVPDFNRSRADQYINAFNALGLTTEEATTSLIRKRIKDFRHEAGKAGQTMPTLKSLYKLGKPAPSKEPLKITAPTNSRQTRLEDAREHWTTWREKGEKLVSDGFLDDLDKRGLEQLKEFQLWLRDQITNRLKS